MLRLITGGSGSGKTEYIMKTIGELLSSGMNRLLLLVPEQFSFETETAVLKRFGPVQAKNVEVLSFTRLAGNLLEHYGRAGRVYADKTAKLVTMSLALGQLSETLIQYKKISSSKGFIRSCLEAVEELKYSGITPEEFETAAVSAGGAGSSQKLTEISSIYSVYSSMLSAKFCDSLDDLALAGELAKQNKVFQDYTVFVDEFKGFTKPEYDMISVILAQCSDCYLSLCLKDEGQGKELFDSLRYTRNRLLQIADKVGAAKALPVKLVQNHRAMYPDLQFWEDAVLQAPRTTYSGESEHVRVFLAQNEYEEVDYALAAICDLVQNCGYRYRDIVLMARDLTPYHDILETAFEKYHLPYFMDDTYTVDNNPLSRFCLALSAVITGNYETTEIIKLLKCSLLPFTLEEIAILENYTYVWGIEGKQWLEPFTANPRGLKGEWTEKDRRDLEIANRIREYIISPLERFKRHTTAQVFEEMVREFYQLLVQLGLPEAVTATIRRYEEAGDFAHSEECRRVWEALVGILETVLRATGRVHGTLRQFFDLLDLAIYYTELADRPQTLDCISAGSADRMRTNSPKLVVVLGANEGVFPYLPKLSGLLDEEDRILLEQFGLDFPNDYRLDVMEERFIAYKALTCATERVLLTARSADISGNSYAESELIFQVRNFFGEKSVINAEAVDPLFYCRTKETAFSKYAYLFCQDTDLAETLKEYFQSDPVYAEKTKILEAMSQKREPLIQNQKLSKALFGTEIKLSPSRIETFYRCKFAYFCSAGLRVLPRRRAELNPLERGNITHDLLYQLVSKEGERLYELTDEELRSEIKGFLEDYMERVTGEGNNGTARFRYLVGRLKHTLFELSKRLIAEFRQSKFRPSDFELDISSSKDLEPVCLTAADGSRVYIEGKIDRVDTYTEGGQTYVRVVDYKSGSKKFKLHELYYGLNLQMVLYLFTIWKNGKNKYKNVLPAGVLYMPAGELSSTLDKHATEADVEKQKLAQYKMNGFVLEDPQVIAAMEQKVEGVFIPVEKTKNGEYSKRSSLMKLEELGKLEQYVEHLVKEMTELLHEGRIEDLPAYSSGDLSPCEYCEYRSVCGHREEDGHTEMKNYSKDELMALFDGKDVEHGTELDESAE